MPRPIAAKCSARQLMSNRRVECGNSEIGRENAHPTDRLVGLENSCCTFAAHLRLSSGDFRHDGADDEYGVLAHEFVLGLRDLVKHDALTDGIDHVDHIVDSRNEVEEDVFAIRRRNLL